VLLVALGLRLWGIRHGLPFIFNIDERAHFVARAVGMYGGDLNPHDFLNPAAFMYALYGLLAVWFGGAQGAARAYANDPVAVFTVARVAVALAGTMAVWLVYLAGARLLDRRAAVLAAALMAVAYLPVFYSKQAINDVPAMAAVAFALWASAAVLRSGRPLHYALAGLGIGVAAGTKYTAVIVTLALLAAAAVRLRAAPRRALAGLALAGALAAAAFLLTNPYAILDHEAFVADLRSQSEYNSGPMLLGEREGSGLLYYGWSLTWGLGFAGIAFAALGAVALAWRDRAVAALLVPAPVVFFVFMGVHGKYFARYLLPAYPFACLLAAAGVAFLVTTVARRRPALAPLVAGAAALALVAQPLVHDVHGSVVDTRTDTRTVARQWMEQNLPRGTRVVQEPIVPREWLRPGGRPGARPEWRRWLRDRALVRRLTRLFPGSRTPSDFQNYVRTLWPGLIDVYEEMGYCWVVSGTTQSGRAFLDPARVPHAVAYYRALRRRARVAFEADPYRAGAQPQPFQFDMSFNSYPLAYERRGPAVTIFRLQDGRCARGARA
jgi:hypothetical protein